jgi:hypothetical protein
MKSELESWTDKFERVTYWRLRLYEFDVIHMSKERLEMIQDGLWLVEQALKGENTEGPLTLPKTRLQIRDGEERVSDV